MKKKLLTAFLAVLGLYIAVSILLSCWVSSSEWANNAILCTRRAPFLLVEYSQSTVIEENGKLCGYNQFGHYIGHGLNNTPSETVHSFMVYSPFNNECDDIIARLDVFKSLRSGFTVFELSI